MLNSDILAAAFCSLTSFGYFFMHPMLNIAIRAARKAGNHIAKSLETTDKIEASQKGLNDFVTNIDNEAETIIIDNNQKLLS